jgi:hypothetical protein
MEFIFGLLMKWFDPSKIITGAINAYMKAKDVDLEKFKSANLSTEHVAAAVLQANVQFAQIKANYALSVLNWWPFRVILFALLFFPATHFISIVLDSSCPISWGLGRVPSKGGCGWGIPSIDPDVKDIYTQLLLFFIIAKPVDTAIAGGMSALQSYLNKEVAP